LLKLEAEYRNPDFCQDYPIPIPIFFLALSTYKQDSLKPQAGEIPYYVSAVIPKFRIFGNKVRRMCQLQI